MSETQVDHVTLARRAIDLGIPLEKLVSEAEWRREQEELRTQRLVRLPDDLADLCPIAIFVWDRCGKTNFLGRSYIIEAELDQLDVDRGLDGMPWKDESGWFSHFQARQWPRHRKEREDLRMYMHGIYRNPVKTCACASVITQCHKCGALQLAESQPDVPFGMDSLVAFIRFSIANKMPPIVECKDVSKVDGNLCLSARKRWIEGAQETRRRNRVRRLEKSMIQVGPGELQDHPHVIEKTFVYMMSHTNGLTKIGRSKRPRAREKTLQAEDPRLAIIWKHAGSMQLEKHLHGQFSGQRVRGEWFDLTAADIERVKSIAKSWNVESDEVEQ